MMEMEVEKREEMMMMMQMQMQQQLVVIKKKRKQKPHPLAGRGGFGLPIAPPGWRWRAGTRVGDMCFYSPDGRSFRSRVHLQKHLAETPGSPPLSDFRFNFRPDDLKDSPLPGELLPDNKVRHFQRRDFQAVERRKLDTTAEFQTLENLSKPFDEHSGTEDLSKALTVNSSVNPTGYIAVGEGVNFLSSTLCPDRFRPAGAKYKYKKGYSFARILSSPTSYVVLWKNPNILQRFLNEGARLTEKNQSELEELRFILLRRKLDSVNLSKYPEGALRVFFFLLRSQEPPPGFGKEELLEFCSEWNCKKKHYWCFSETQRLRGSATTKSSVEITFQQSRAEDPRSFITEATTAATEKEKVREAISSAVKAELCDARGLSDLRTSAQSENRYAEPKEVIANFSVDELSESLSQATYNTLFGEDNLTSVPEDRCSGGVDLQCTSTLTDRDFQNDDIPSQIRANSDQLESDQALQGLEKSPIYTLSEQEGANQPAAVTVSEDPALSPVNCETLTSHQSQEMIYDTISGPKSLVPYTQHLSDGEVKSMLATSFERRELALFAKEFFKKRMRIDACLCDPCTVDPTFCYGCQCSICRVEISLKQNWSFVHCAGCNHVCHLECALKARKAGVVTEMGLDGEFLCPSCLRKRDLIQFWKERVNNASISADISVIEKQLFSAVLVLNGTQRELYQSINDKLRELHSSVLHNSPFSELIECLQQIKKDVDALDDMNEQTSDFEEITEELLWSFQAGDLLTEESKVLECKKKAELDNAEWLQAEDLVSIERLKLKEAIEWVKKLEEEAKLRADYARASKRHLQQAERRLQFLKTFCRARVVSNEHIDIQRAALNRELSELNRLQIKLGSFSYESPDLSVADFSLLSEYLKVQRKRVESAQAMLEHLHALENIFK